jgi:hypothetical protein
MPHVTHVQITVDQVELQTLKMALAALQLAAQSVTASLDAQVQAALEAHAAAEQPKHNPPPAEANGHFKSAPP